LGFRLPALGGVGYWPGVDQPEAWSPAPDALDCRPPWSSRRAWPS